MTPSHVRFARAPASQVRTGLLGYARFRLGLFEFDSVRVCRTADGRHVLRFPSKRDGQGVERPFVRPIDAGARAEIERAVLAELRTQGALP